MKFKYSFSIISKLYTASLIWFGATVISLIYVLLNFCFPSTDFMIKGKTFSIGSTNISKKGYMIPVKMTINLPPDTILKYTNGEMYLRKNNFFRNSDADSIINDTSSKKEIYLFKWIAHPSVYDHEYFTTDLIGKNDIETFKNKVSYHSNILDVNTNDNYVFDTELLVKSKKKYQNFLLLLNQIIGSVFLLIISFQFMKIFKQLYQKISFINNIYRRLNIAGISIILSQFIEFIFSIIFQFWYGRVSLLTSTDNGKGNMNMISVQFNPSTGSSFNLLILGLCILVLSYIFKYGNKLEEENALTV